MAAFVLALAIHLIASVIWVGGMFFAHMVLRPSVMDMAPPERLALWSKVLPRFFAWVWASIAALLVTGYGVLFLGYRGGIGGGGLHIDIMQATGLIMVANFIYLYFGPFGGFKTLLAAGDIKGAAAAQGRIRQIVTINLVLGLVTLAVGGTGTLWAY
ncbi:Integral membrane protein [Magnetospirillum sp. LM-5]|uniref:CopD family protein n=1 Tax=Magnetospirillum sp. LM-5 TaxID=2681466 RepID=UPI001383CFAF|nr:CopD family protein [Magnetospirillum sp. LM-5]CAA7620350.1 Integral membrane protein [Magnetospirillum sp. LM-5]